MMSYPRNLVMLVAALMTAAVVAGPALADHPKHEIDALNIQWVTAFKARDFATIQALMAPDTLLLVPNASPVQGPEVAIETWKSWGELPGVSITFGAQRVEAAASGDLAYDYGAYTFAFDTDKGPFVENGKYIVVWKKIDGAWKIAADIFNSNGSQ